MGEILSAWYCLCLGVLVYPWLREGDTGSDKEAAQAGDSRPDLATEER